jgi:hypothetical protein
VTVNPARVLVADGARPTSARAVSGVARAAVAVGAVPEIGRALAGDPRAEVAVAARPMTDRAADGVARAFVAVAARAVIGRETPRIVPVGRDAVAVGAVPAKATDWAGMIRAPKATW